MSGTALALAGLALSYQPVLTSLGEIATQCAAGRGSASEPAWCSLVLRCPNRLPAILLGLIGVALLLLGVPLARWCLAPVSALVEVVERMGPASLGYRLGWGRRRDVVGRLGTVSTP